MRCISTLFALVVLLGQPAFGDWVPGELGPLVQVERGEPVAMSKRSTGVSSAPMIRYGYRNTGDRAVTAWTFRCVVAMNDGREGWTDNSVDLFAGPSGPEAFDRGYVEAGEVLEIEFGQDFTRDGIYAVQTCGLVAVVLEGGEAQGAPEVIEEVFVRRRALAADVNATLQGLDAILDGDPKAVDGDQLAVLEDLAGLGVAHGELSRIKGVAEQTDRVPRDELRALRADLQAVFDGCRKDFSRFYETAGRCPCAPSCSTDGLGEPNEWVENGESPVVLSLHDGSLELSSPDDPVLFDIDGNGVEERITWTAAGSDEAFLVLDRDRDGEVDDGRELFGNNTPQLPSAEPNGFRALAVFDDPLNGGNGDGWIDPLDTIYSHLQLWVDADHDGLTGPGELSTLAENGVEALGIRYTVSQRRDPHGNVLRYQAPVRRTAGPGARVAWDVFFQVLED